MRNGGVVRRLEMVHFSEQSLAFIGGVSARKAGRASGKGCREGAVKAGGLGTRPKRNSLACSTDLTKSSDSQVEFSGLTCQVAVWTAHHTPQDSEGHHAYVRRRYGCLGNRQGPDT